MVTGGIVPFPPRFLPSVFIANRVQQSHCSSIFHRVLLTHALAFSTSDFVRKKKSPRIYTSMHSGGFELTKLTCTRLEDNLIRHRGDRPLMLYPLASLQSFFLSCFVCSCRNCHFVSFVAFPKTRPIKVHIGLRFDNSDGENDDFLRQPRYP